jgi:hypothetical protein
MTEAHAAIDGAARDEPLDELVSPSGVGSSEAFEMPPPPPAAPPP